MEVYILDSLRRNISVVDKYESLIWTERFSAYGDFELRTHSTLDNRARLVAGLWISIEASYRIMVIETVEDTTDDEGRDILVVRGRSIEYILTNRLARSTLNSLTAQPKWTITDDPAAIARKYFHDICVTGVLNSGDIIAGVNESRMPLLPADTVAEPTDVITFEIDPIDLYEATKKICDIYAMGFRFVRHPTTWVLYYDIYMGSDRTTQQTTLPAVVFSTSMDNLSNTTELTSIALHKNVAYVLSPVGTEVVYAEDETVTDGFGRNVLVVVAEDITSGVPATASAQMIQRGKEELARHKRFTAFDGELNQNSKYKYGTDYNLGDLVEFQNEAGTSSLMKVTEQIFVSDKEGFRSFPTLVIDAFITPGSWDDYAPDATWDSQSDTLNWDEL